MTFDNDNEPGEQVFYFFSYKFENEGIVQSKLGETETRDKLNRELATIYGPDGVNLTALRTATEQEVADYKAALQTRYGLTPDDVEKMSQPPTETKTIN